MDVFEIVATLPERAMLEKDLKETSGWVAV